MQCLNFVLDAASVEDRSIFVCRFGLNTLALLQDAILVLRVVQVLDRDELPRGVILTANTVLFANLA